MFLIFASSHTSFFFYVIGGKSREIAIGEKAIFGVDVGTGSVRAALVSYNGKILGSHVVPIKIHNPQQDFYEQSSDDIWSAVCNAVQQVATLAEKVILFSQW